MTNQIERAREVLRQILSAYRWARVDQDGDFDGALEVLMRNVALTNEAAPAWEVERECIEALEAKDRLLRAVLAAIDTGRSEPLFIVRDQLRNYLGDYTDKASTVLDPAILATAVEAASRMPPEIVRRPLGVAALNPVTNEGESR